MPIDNSSRAEIYLGLGVNRVTTRLGAGDSPGLNRAVQGRLVPGSKAGRAHYSICRTASELAQAMQQQAGASLSGLGFLPLLSAKRSFYQTLNSTTFSLTILVQSRCITEAASLIEPHLLPGIDLSALDTFVSAYGDSFINGVSLGGEFLAAYTFRSENNDQLRSLERELKAGGLLMDLGTPLDVAVSLHDVVSNVEKSSRISVELTYEVLGAPKPSLQADAVVDYALSFNESSIQHPALLDLTTLGYERIPEMSETFAAVETNRERFIGEDGLLQQRDRIDELINQIDDTRTSLRLYGIQLADEEELSAAKRQAEADLNAFKAVEQSYRTAASKPLSIPEFPSLALGSPEIAATVAEDPATTAGQWESSPGNPFFIPEPYSPKTAIQNRLRLTRIAIEAGSQLDKLTLDYSTRNEKERQTVTHGGDRAQTRRSVLELDQAEGVTEIYSEFGTHLDKLILTTNKGSIGGGGDRGDRQHPLVWKKAPNEVVLGFAGRSDDDPKGAVYALRAIVARFEGIHWQKLD